MLYYAIYIMLYYAILCYIIWAPLTLIGRCRAYYSTIYHGPSMHGPDTRDQVYGTVRTYDKKTKLFGQTLKFHKEIIRQHTYSP